MENREWNWNRNRNLEILNGKWLRRFIVLLAFTIIFASGFIVFGWLYSESEVAKNKFGNSLESNYERAVYELVDNVNNISLNLSKANVSNDELMQRKYLQLVCDNCKYAQSNFAVLPITISASRDGVSFINQLDGYCSTLVIQDSDLSADQKAILNDLFAVSERLKVVLNQLVQKILNGYSILDGSEDVIDGVTDFSYSFLDLSEESIKYPTMIYDGPFADSIYNKEILGLTGDEISKEEAQEILISVLEGSDYKEIVFEDETTGNFVTFNFEVKCNSGNSYYAQITKKGGFLLTLNGYCGQSETINYDESQCIELGLEFASKAGVQNLECVWKETTGGVCIMNFAVKQGNVILYPDLIKIKVDMVSGSVVGYEAQNYAYNHHERSGLTPSITLNSAMDKISDVMDIQSETLCIIPLDYTGETLAYEFKCEYLGDTYFVYIDANDGKEIRVLKVIKTSESELTE